MKRPELLVSAGLATALALSPAASEAPQFTHSPAVVSEAAPGSCDTENRITMYQAVAHIAASGINAGKPKDPYALTNYIWGTAEATDAAHAAGANPIVEFGLYQTLENWDDQRAGEGNGDKAHAFADAAKAETEEVLLKSFGLEAPTGLSGDYSTIQTQNAEGWSNFPFAMEPIVDENTTAFELLVTADNCGQEPDDPR